MLASLGLTALLAAVKGRLAGSFMPYLAAGIAAFVLVLGLAWGVHAIRADAAADRDLFWEARMAKAKSAAADELAARVRASEEIAAKQRAELANELATAVTRARDLEDELKTIPRGVAYPAAIAKRLSQ